MEDVSKLSGREALRRKGEVQAALASTKGDPSKLEERAALKRENEALDARLRDAKEAQKADNMRRCFAGIGSPLHEAVVARFGAIVARELEADALARQGERERRTAERKALKGEPGKHEAVLPAPSRPAAASRSKAPPRPRPVDVEVFVTARSAAVMGRAAVSPVRPVANRGLHPRDEVRSEFFEASRWRR